MGWFGSCDRAGGDEIEKVLCRSKLGEPCIGRDLAPTVDLAAELCGTSFRPLATYYGHIDYGSYCYLQHRHSRAWNLGGKTAGVLLKLPYGCGTVFVFTVLVAQFLLGTRSRYSIASRLGHQRIGRHSHNRRRGPSQNSPDDSSTSMQQELLHPPNYPIPLSSETYM